MFKKWLSNLMRDILWWWAKIFLGPPLRLFFRVKAHGKKPFPPPGKPAFIIANHTNLLDPFIIADFFNRPIRYVVSDEYFRYRPLRILLKILKGIPKTKFVPDSITMRRIIEAIREGDLIGIFPEGARNWDGETIYFDETIPKLIKKFKIPVISIQMQGAFLSFPRWANLPRRGKIILKFQYLFENPDKIPEDTQRIKKIIENSLNYNELEHFRLHNLKFKFKGINPAEHLELRLWLCPVCRTFFSLKSRGRYLYCVNCDAKWEYRKDGHFKMVNHGKFFNSKSKTFSHYLEWVKWNDEETINIYKDLTKLKKDIFFQIKAKMWSAKSSTTRERNFKFNGPGKLILRKGEKLVFIRESDQENLLNVSLKEIKGAAVTWNHKFEFFVNGRAYRFTFYGQSAYFWHFLTKLIQKNKIKGGA